jgi:hypothetical protein
VVTPAPRPRVYLTNTLCGLRSGSSHGSALRFDLQRPCLPAECARPVAGLRQAATQVRAQVLAADDRRVEAADNVDARPGIRCVRDREIARRLHVQRAQERQRFWRRRQDALRQADGAIVPGW